MVQAISTYVKNQQISFLVSVVLLQRVQTSQIDVFTHRSSCNSYVQQPLHQEMTQFCKLFCFFTSQVVMPEDTSIYDAY